INWEKTVWPRFMVHCRSPTKCLKNGHFPSNQIQIVPDSNCCKLFMDNGLPAGANFSPDTSAARYSPGRLLRAGYPQHLHGVSSCGWPYRLAAHGSVGGPALQPLTWESV